MIEAVEGEVVDPEMLTDVCETIFQDEELASYWDFYDKFINSDRFHYFSATERLHFQMLGVLYMDLVKSIAVMNRTERIATTEKQYGAYKELARYQEIMSKMEEKAKIRAEKREKDGIPWGTSKKANRVEVETDDEKITMTREKKEAPFTVDDLEDL